MKKKPRKVFNYWLMASRAKPYEKGDINEQK